VALATKTKAAAIMFHSIFMFFLLEEGNLYIFLYFLLVGLIN